MKNRDSNNEYIIPQLMDSIRVDVCYRPLRVAWAISAGDFESFRVAVRTSYALWGGRYNPVVIVEHESAGDLVDLFRVDVVLPIGEAASVKAFPARFPHLIKPFSLPDSVFAGDGTYGSPCHILDIQNAVLYLRGRPEWDRVKEAGFRLYRWKPDDPLADSFLVQLGEYLNPDVTAIDYRQLVKNAAEPEELDIDPTSVLPFDTFDHPSISFLSRVALDPHYSSPQSGWDYPGFYSGDLGNLEDLVCFWNLRAADIPVMFVDPKHVDRYGDTIERQGKAAQQLMSRDELRAGTAVWARVDAETNSAESLDSLLKPFKGKAGTVCRIPGGMLTRTRVRPPTMCFSEVSTLGIIGDELGKPKISFALEQKPFHSDVWFHTQRLVASISFLGGLYGDEQHTLVPPFVPELNEFYARAMHFEYDTLRIEPGRLGLVIDPHDHSTFIYALPVRELFEKIFRLAGFSTKPSAAGLIARQLIAQFGGADRARALKIPGVRRLVKTYGPTDSFTRRGAIQLIGSKDPESPNSNFSDYENLYIEPRPRQAKLTPEAVFAFLVEKGLFRMGAELECPNCRLPSWTALDALRQEVVCELCGHQFNATRQLVREDWHYRRSGVLGREKNSQGAIPVVLTLQQLKFNLHGLSGGGAYSTSLDLEPNSADLPKCELDFVWLQHDTHSLSRTVLIIGECKDRGRNREKGNNSGTIDVGDIENLRRVADALPKKRFETFIALVKLCPFAPEEIALAKSLNSSRQKRVILLTSQELEPMHFFERSEQKLNSHSAADLAMATETIYFQADAAKKNAVPSNSSAERE